MTDTHTDRLRKIVGEQVTTIAGSSEEGSADGAECGGGAFQSAVQDSFGRAGAVVGFGIRQGGQYPGGGGVSSASLRGSIKAPSSASVLVDQLLSLAGIVFLYAEPQSQQHISLTA